VSILAGKTIANLQRQIPRTQAIVRAMPNLAASIRRSATVAVATKETTDKQKKLAHELLSSVGTVEWLATEDLIDAVTAVSGSGPAYFFYLAECLAHAGARAVAGTLRAPSAGDDDRGRGTPIPEPTAARKAAARRDLSRRHHGGCPRSSHGQARPV
jgi:hypothetical protein